MARYEGDPLKLKNFSADLFLEEASERMLLRIHRHHDEQRSKVSCKQTSPGAISDFNTWLPRSNYLVSRLVVFGSTPADRQPTLNTSF